MFTQIRHAFGFACFGGMLVCAFFYFKGYDWIVLMDKPNWTCTNGDVKPNTEGCEQWTRK